MSHQRPRALRSLTSPIRFVAVAVALMALTACGASGGTPSPVTTIEHATSTTEHVLPTPAQRPPIPINAAPTTNRPGSGSGVGHLSPADGYIPDDEMLSPFDTQYPAVGNLQPELLQAVQHAALDAKADGVAILINSGWRSKRYQQALLDQAIATYGSETEARKWVNTPEQSTHVRGEAVDIGPAAADRWLAQYGNRYGLCQIYSNEVWHFERVIEPGGVCPPRIDNATEGSVDQYRSG